MNDINTQPNPVDQPEVNPTPETEVPFTDEGFLQDGRFSDTPEGN